MKAGNMKIRLTKCYLDRTKSKEYGEKMKEELLRKQNEKEI